MIQWYLSVKNALRAIEKKSRDALALYEQGEKEAASTLNVYLTSDYEQLWDLWRQRYPDENLGSLGRHIHFGKGCDYQDIIDRDVPSLEKRADSLLLSNNLEQAPQLELGFEHLLHPVITEHCYQLFRDGHLREAVLNSITAVFDFIRYRTGSVEDGDRLIGKVMSMNEPLLILSELTTESGENDQKGFMQIYKGAFQGIRNPKAHSLTHDLTHHKAAQYLVFSSLLARRIEEATIVNT